MRSVYFCILTFLESSIGDKKYSSKGIRLVGSFFQLEDCGLLFKHLMVASIIRIGEQIEQEIEF